MKRSDHRIVALLLGLLLSHVAVANAQTDAKQLKWNERVAEWVEGEPWVFETSLPMAHTKRLVGYSWRGILDEYLSPIHHKGWGANYRVLHDSPKQKDSSYHMYQELLLDIGAHKNPANQSGFYTIGGSFSAGPSWRVVNGKGFTLDVAPLLSLDIQGNFKLSNSNNLGNLKASAGADGWGRARYTIPWKVMPLSVSYSAQILVLRLAFYPNFGQSYYEYISGENRTAPKLHLTSFHNSLSLRQRFLIDLPINNITLNLGAEHFYTNEKVSSTTFRQGYWSILIGVSIDSFRLSGAKSRSKQIRSAYYD